MSTTDGGLFTSLAKNVTLPIEVESLEPPVPIKTFPSGRIRICPDCCGSKHNCDGQIGWGSEGRLPGYVRPTDCVLCEGAGHVECLPAEGGP